VCTMSQVRQVCEKVCGGPVGDFLGWRGQRFALDGPHFKSQVDKCRGSEAGLEVGGIYGHGGRVTER